MTTTTGKMIATFVSKNDESKTSITIIVRAIPAQILPPLLNAGFHYTIINPITIKEKMKSHPKLSPKAS